jgi:hypothetical protein
MWTINGEHVINWPGTVITLRQAARVIEDNRQVLNRVG